MDTQEMGTQRGEIICQGYPVSSNAWTRVQVFSSFFLCDSPLILIYLFYWKINASQDWTGFCWTAMWISSLSLPRSLSCSLTLTHSLCLSLSLFTHTHTHTLLSIPRTSPPHATLWVSTGHQAEAPVLSGGCPLAIYFTHGGVYMSIPAPKSSHPFCPLCSTSPTSMSASPFLPCK